MGTSCTVQDIRVPASLKHVHVSVGKMMPSAKGAGSASQGGLLSQVSAGKASSNLGLGKNS